MNCPGNGAFLSPPFSGLGGAVHRGLLGAQQLPGPALLLQLPEPLLLRDLELSRFAFSSLPPWCDLLWRGVLTLDALPFKLQGVQLPARGADGWPMGARLTSGDAKAHLSEFRSSGLAPKQVTEPLAFAKVVLPKSVKSMNPGSEKGVGKAWSGGLEWWLGGSVRSACQQLFSIALHNYMACCAFGAFPKSAHHRLLPWLVHKSS